jgi:hypothetical protein
MNGIRRTLAAVIAVTAAACSDASNPTVPSPRAIEPETASPTLIGGNNTLGGVSASVLAPDNLTAGGTGTFRVTMSAPAVGSDPTPMEVVFVMDASGSVTSSGWQTEKAAVVAQINTGLPLAAKIGIVQFDDASEIKYTFNQAQTPRSAITNLVQNLPFTAGTTATLAAMQDAYTIFNTTGSPDTITPRHRIVILLTDGNPNPPSTQNPCGTTTAAKNLRTNLDKKNIETYIVAVGPDITSGTLSCLIDNDPSRFIAVENFNGVTAGLNAAFQELHTVKNATYQVTLDPAFTLPASLTAPSGTTIQRLDAHTFNWTAATLSGTSPLLVFTATASASACGTINAQVSQSVSYSVGGSAGTIPLSNQAVTFASCDNSAPMVEPSITGTAGLNGWYTSDVTVHWNVADAESSVGPTTGCADATVTTNTTGTTFTCSATSAGGTTEKSVTIKRDTEVPGISPVVDGTVGGNGWYTTDVGVGFDIGYGVSGAGTLEGCTPAPVMTDGEQTITCTATSAAGLSASKSITIKRDASKPVITPAISSPANAAGWYTSNVSVTWTVADAQSAIATSNGCTNVTLSEDTNGVTYTCSATNGAGLVSSNSVTLKRDATTPTITANVSGAMGANGWYTGNVSVSFATSFGISGAGSTSGCAAATVTTDTNGQTFTCSTSSAAGLSATKQVTIKRDATRPTVAFAGNAGSYTVDQMVSITCSASDAGSGIATSSCPNVSAPASSLTIGVNTLNGTATDIAGNAATASTSFTVVLTTGSFTNLITSTVHGDGLKTLLNRMKNIVDKVNKQNPSLDSQIKNFLKELDRAKADGDVSAADAATLARLVQLFQ